MKKILLLLLPLSMALTTAAQTQLRGIITEGANPVANASVQVKNSTTGTTTNEKGEFLIAVPSLPTALVISAIGFDTQEIAVTSGALLRVSLTGTQRLLEPLVVGGVYGGIPQRITELPVSAEHFGLREIRNNPSSDYYNLLTFAKGVDVTTSSLTFKTYSTRGFNYSGSARVNQLTDGIDNQTPGLNFPIGNFAGLTELDVASIEVLPGASSALYGPGGMNGTILINSKSPFQYQGLSVLVKQGVTNVDKTQRPDREPYHDISLRYAKAFNRFAFKIGAQYLKATDWLAGDESNYSRLGDVGRVIPGNRATDPNYDGVNVYGDETSVNIRPFLQAFGAPAEDIFVSRTGYHERDVIDPTTKNVKLSGALHYKLSTLTEAQLMGYWGTGNTVYTGNNRYALKDIKIGQYKLEIRNPNWFLRSYTTQENAGEAYSATAAMQVFNELWKPSYNPNNQMGSWYPQFTGAYLQARGAGMDKATALQAARQFADQGWPQPGTTEFNQLFDKARSIPLPNGGLFKEKSQLWMTEAQYNLSKLIPAVEIIAGGSWKRFVLHSAGTIFIDTLDPISINEWGAYAQATKKLGSRLTLSFAGRYDKNQDFKGRFTPRATALLHIANGQNLRFSYQTAYRFPTSTQRYVRLDVGSYTILGGLPWVMDYMQSPVVELDGTTPKPYVSQPLKPESMRSFEAGYKGLIGGKLLVDVYGYFGKYTDFLGRNVLLDAKGEIYSTVVNSTTEVNTYGAGIGFDYRMPKNFFLTLNGYHDVLTDVPSGFQAFFNTPKYRATAGFGNTGLGKAAQFGFSVMARWQDAFFSEGELANGPVDAFTTIDAMVSYRLPKIRGTIKLGGTNILNHYYKNAYANPEIGGLYYVSFGYGL
ncbi:MAG TPA: TonB-dependent receptor [Flavisolibacter sp.]|jgi:outer membrane receptor protein involved in Fe transport|nr:TonB-dependent receptor [Flavisolibacter sp.]